MVLPLEPFPHRISKETPATPVEKRETAVLAFEKDSAVGEVIWETARRPAEQVNQAIRDVLVRKPARFFDVTIESVEKEDLEKKGEEDHKQESALLPSEGDDADGSAETSVEIDGRIMSIEEMGQMKVELHQTLGLAWNELNKIAELCRSLISSQPHPYVLPPNEATASIPAKSLSATLADRAPPTQAVRLLGDTKLAIVRHIDAIKRSQAVFADGSKRLKTLTAEEDVYWRNVLSISGLGYTEGAGQEDKERDGNAESTGKRTLAWALLPRPLSNGHPPTRQIATDVMIPYAPDEAGSGFRALAMATMVQRKSSSQEHQTEQKASEISYRARRHKRLRICVKSDTGEETFSRVTGLADPTAREPIPSDISKAQAEMFDDEVFETIRIEAQNSPTLNTRSSVDQISIDAVPGQELIFEMVDTDDVFEEQRNGSTTISTKANLLAALLRVGMLRIYRSRRSKTSIPSAPGSPQARLLAPVVAYMHYQAFCQHLFRILGGFQHALREVGLDLEIRKCTGGLTGGLDWEGFMDDDDDSACEERKSNLKGNVELLVNQREFCTILLSSDAHLTIVFSHTIFKSQDIAQLPIFLGQELRREILSVIIDELKSTSESVKFGVDEIAGVIKTKPTKLEIAFTPEDPPQLCAQSSRIMAEGSDGDDATISLSRPRIVIEHYSKSEDTPLIPWAVTNLV